jgi:hypothetical protein
MKDKYFGDVNDYKKYILLRLLSKNGKLKVMVCWMLTAGDLGGDGNKISYLGKPDIWKKYDPAVFDHLKKHVITKKSRGVKSIQNSSLLKGCRFFDMVITDNPKERVAYFDRLSSAIKNTDIVFFDPDNGIEVKSVPYGKKNSSKYVYLKEIKETYSSGHSVLIYQHFPRKEHRSYVKNIVKRLKSIDGLETVLSFSTSNVVFILLPQKRHEAWFVKTLGIMDKKAGEIVKPRKHSIKTA